MTGLAIVLSLLLGLSAGANVVLVVWLRRALRRGGRARVPTVQSDALWRVTKEYKTN